ncbi:hypothetical protein QQZ08_010260 [Neonectria magnoliae]|uniref:Uncharacterized protein n=1 Tax=Neonectria magnoliae TaxID=2732573 RepID=A0ABR1HIJ5_9HYPO
MDRPSPDAPPPTAATGATSPSTAAAPVHSHDIPSPSRDSASAPRVVSSPSLLPPWTGPRAPLANISEPLIRPRQAGGALVRLSLLPSSNPSSEPTSPNKNNQLKSSSNQSLSSANLDSKLSNQAALANHRPSQPSIARLYSRFLAKFRIGVGQISDCPDRIWQFVNGFWKSSNAVDSTISGPECRRRGDERSL